MMGEFVLVSVFRVCVLLYIHIHPPCIALFSRLPHRLTWSPGAQRAAREGKPELTPNRDRRLVEMDGSRATGPFDWGECTSLLHVSQILVGFWFWIWFWCWFWFWLLGVVDWVIVGSMCPCARCCTC